MNTTTPKRQATSADLQSTPQSTGSSVRSKDLHATGLAVSTVGPWIARDVENAQNCEVDEMLKSFLLDCIDDDDSMTQDPGALFKTCQESVLPICNGIVSKNGVDSADIRTHLKNYSSSQRETELYSHFVRAANIALFHLQDLDQINGLRKPSKQLVFQVYGKEIKQYHQETSSFRKPDVVLVSAADVRVNGKHSSVLEAASEQAEKSFDWRDVRTVIEFKIRRKNINPPPDYTNNDSIEPAPQYKYLSPKAIRDGSVIPSSSGSFLQESESQRSTIENSAIRKRKEFTRETQYESENRGSRSSSKRPRFESREMRPETQTGLYGTEMFSSHAGRQHVFCITIIGQYLYLWRYDRQRPIQCSTLDFIRDLPRFLVLLLAMQRFENRHWGLNRHVDPDFGKLSTTSTTVLIEDPKEGAVDIVLDCSPDKRVSHYGLNGRATNMYSVTSQKFRSKGKLISKFFWGEESRVGEPDILEKVYKIAEMEPDVRDHVPVMVFSHVFLHSSTAIIRERLGLPKEGSRVLYMIIFEELIPITKLTGGHLALWKNGVYHRDISASNLMHKDQEGNVVGVLNDFDLATMAPGPTGNERTGTLPFMAQDLLSEDGQEGKIKHVYAHDAESFIWVLTWICLRYGDGILRKSPPLDAWLNVDAEGCMEKKASFLLYHNTTMRKHITPGKGHEQNWVVAKRGLAALKLFPTHSDECEGPFRTLLEPLWESRNLETGEGV